MVKLLNYYRNRALLLSFLLASFYPILYLVFELLTPKGFVFSGMVGGDDGTNLAVMASVEHNFENGEGVTASDRLEMIKKYDIEYVYFGEYERVVSDFKLNLGKESFFGFSF